MKRFMILFVVGQDRPGIVDDVSTILFERGANIEDSRMATLGGCFSIMILFSTPAEHLANVLAGMDRLKNQGFDVSAHDAQDPASLVRPAELPLKLRVTAMDHPGIVTKVVRILRKYDVNIESLNTRVLYAPLSGAPLFDLDLESAVPASQPISRVKAELSELADVENLDLTFIK
jgi:glycine cleavage system transcriptional repressor